MHKDGKLTLALKVQLVGLLITLLIVFATIVSRVATAENRISKLENENSELKQMVVNIDKKIDAIYLKLIPNAK